MKWKRTEAQSAARQFRLRGWWVLGTLTLVAAGILARAVELQFIDRGFYEQRGAERYSRNLKIPAHRGSIVDRYGEPLAVSTPVDTVWANPSELLQASDQLPRLAKALSRERDWLTRRVTSSPDSQYVVLAKQLQPDEALKIKALGIPGVYLQREYRRYYPTGEVTGHVLGFTGADDQGQEGLELAYEQKLAGEDGLKRVIQDRMGRVVENVDSIRAARPGEDLAISIDLRIQYLAYRELKSAIREFQARSGSVIVVDVRTGEVLAMVNQPSFNPNDRTQFEVARYRNRAATDILEPGSSIKPFIISVALASGKYKPGSTVDTNPGFIKVGTKQIEDPHNLGIVDLATILAKSSNVGMAHVALSLDKSSIWETLNALGFGQVSPSGFPGESAGVLTHYSHWRELSVATLAYGYGISVTPVQLAQAYSTIAAGGIRRPLSFRRLETPPAGQRVLDTQVSRDVVHLIEHVVTADGTAPLARIPGYKVAGKTGTAFKSTAGGYSSDKYMAVFAGMVPASAPRLVAVVVIDEPMGTVHHGGDVAAPVFSAVMAGALRLLAIPPDDLTNVPSATLVQAVTPRWTAHP